MTVEVKTAMLFSIKLKIILKSETSNTKKYYSFIKNDKMYLNQHRDFSFLF